jgi:hypothetical protein
VAAASAASASASISGSSAIVSSAGAAVSVLSSVPTCVGCVRSISRAGEGWGRTLRTFDAGLRLLARDAGFAAVLDGGFWLPLREPGAFALDGGLDPAVLEAGLAFDAGLALLSGFALLSGLDCVTSREV